MKKRILSALLCLCIVFGLVPVTVWAATWNGHTHYLCGGSTCSGSGHENESGMTTFAMEIKQEGGALYIGNTEWPVSAYGSYALDGGVYYLSTNLTPDHMIQCNGNVTLCLNGHSITANHDGDVIAVNSGVTFTLTDCKGGNSDAAFGKITHASGKNGSGVYVDSATFNMTGGSITGNTASSSSSSGGGVYVNGGSFKMSGGTISSNTARSGGGVYVYSRCTFEMSSGTISSNTATGNGGGVYVEGGTFTMSGGSIGGTNANEANTAAINGGGVYVAGKGSFTMSANGQNIPSIIGNTATSYGGGVHISYASATFTMKGGSITGNKVYNSNSKSTFGGGVCVGNGTFTMTDGSITGNNAIYGGGVYTANKFNMSGGSITGNNADSNGGGVYVMYSDSFTVSGEVTVTDNTKGGTKGADGKFTGDTKNNVYIPTNKTITIGTDKLSEGAKLGVTLDGYYGDKAFTSGWKTEMGDKSPSDYFISDVGGKGFELSGGEVKLCDGHTHYLCGGSICNSSGHEEETSKTIFAKEIKQEGDKLYIDGVVLTKGSDGFYHLPAGDYFLSSDIATDTRIQIDAKVTLCLNGHTIKRTTDNKDDEYYQGCVIVVAVNGNFTLTDCTDAGKITHDDGKAGRGVHVMGTFNMYGGKICNNTAQYGGGVYVGKDCTFTMYGGSITGNTATKYGGGVYVYGGTFKMTNGSIADNTASVSGGGVCVDYEYSSSAYGKFEMSGGSITGNNAGGNGGGVAVYGTFTVSGNVTVTGNTKGATKGTDGKFAGGTNSNIYLNGGSYYTSPIIIGAGGLSDDAKLGVTLANNYGDNAFTSGWGTYMGSKTPADYFTSDVDGYEAKLYDTELKLVSTHVHIWTYTASGDTITATCKSCQTNGGEDYSGGTAKIIAADATYDRNEKAATVSKTGIFENVDMSISYSKYNAMDGMYHPINAVPTDASKYKASFTLGNATASVTYTINKATQVAPTGLTTKGDIKNSGTGEIQNTAEDMEYNISANATTGWITCDNGSTRVAPGTYYVRYKENDNYYASDVSAALTVDAHTHSGGNATCQEKAICDGCRQAYGELGNHNFTETVDGKHPVSAATCGSKAVYNKSCSVCGVKSDETFETGEYDYTNHIGSTYKKNQKEATCYAEGYTGDIYCSTCNHKIEKGTPIAKNAHNPASVWTTDETDHWKECQTVGCGNIIDKAHHSGGEATCVNKAICVVCKIEYGDVDATNHKHTEVRGAKDATCCEKGYTGDTYCTDCNALIQHLLRQVSVCVRNLALAVEGENAFTLHIGFGYAHGRGNNGIKYIDFHTEVFSH